MLNNEISPFLQGYLDVLPNDKLRQALVTYLKGNLNPSSEELKQALIALGVILNAEDEHKADIRRRNIEAFPSLTNPVTPGKEMETEQEMQEQMEKWRRRLEEIGKMPEEERMKYFFEALALNQDLNLYESLNKRTDVSSAD